jgi:ASC-1-like (ASCH) protein
MRLLRRYFDLVASGRKTVEVRVADARRAAIAAGDTVRFRCGEQWADTLVTGVRRYRSFAGLLAHEPLAALDPTAGRDEQLANLRRIYPPEREALGVMAIGVALLGPP